MGLQGITDHNHIACFHHHEGQTMHIVQMLVARNAQRKFPDSYELLQMLLVVGGGFGCGRTFEVPYQFNFLVHVLIFVPVVRSNGGRTNVLNSLTGVKNC